MTRTFPLPLSFDSEFLAHNLLQSQSESFGAGRAAISSQLYRIETELPVQHGAHVDRDAVQESRVLPSKAFSLQIARAAHRERRTVKPDVSPLQVPVVFGHWLVDGSKLLCRLPRKTVTIRAPKKLIIEVMRYCDGSMPWADVLARLNSGWEPATVTAFMLDLVGSGVLVEASELWASWGDIAQLPATAAIVTRAEDMGLLHQVAEKRLLPGQGNWLKDVRLGANHLAKVLTERESIRTFDDSAVSVECLCSVLWAAHGVTRPGENGAVAWHRTIASGGNMHSARWFVAVLRDLPSEDMSCKPLPVGIYEARFHKLGGASLKKVSTEVSEAWRCLRDPRVLQFASALVLPIYDVAVPAKKYGNRASLFAMIEAGQALQNAQLMLTELGAAGMLRGDTIAQSSLEMLDLKSGSSHWFVVPSLVLGAKPSRTQVRQQLAENTLKIAPNLRLPGKCYAFAAGPATAEASTGFTASGRSGDPRIALKKAEAEGWERLAWAPPCVEGEVARFVDTHDAIDPRSLVTYSARQYARKDFPCLPFSVRRQHLWVKATDVASGRINRVLAECVYANTSLPRRFQKSAFTSASTSGVAAGSSLQDALRRATLELIERDAFVRVWSSRRAPRSVRVNSLPRSASGRIAELVRSGFRIVVSDLSTDWAPVVSVFAQSEQLPLTAITAAAHFSAEQALEKALDEMEGRIAHAQQFGRPAFDDADPMRQIERHFRSRRTFGRSDFYAEAGDIVAFRSVGCSSFRDWEQLHSGIVRDGFSLLMVDMTPDGAAVEQGRVPLHVVRALVPGMVPIWFQAGLQPEGMPRLLQSVGGAKGAPTSRLFIHPFT